MSFQSICQEHSYRHRPNSPWNRSNGISMCQQLVIFCISKYLSIYYRKSYINNNCIRLYNIWSDKSDMTGSRYDYIRILRIQRNVWSKVITTAHGCSCSNTHHAHGFSYYITLSKYDDFFSAEAYVIIFKYFHHSGRSTGSKTCIISNHDFSLVFWMKPIYIFFRINTLNNF